MQNKNSFILAQLFSTEHHTSELKTVIATSRHCCTACASVGWQFVDDGPYAPQSLTLHRATDLCVDRMNDFPAFSKRMPLTDRYVTRFVLSITATHSRLGCDGLRNQQRPVCQEPHRRASAGAGPFAESTTRLNGAQISPRHQQVLPRRHFS